ncbi:uncharacterized protein isoform X2 [Choristoneura fumiferana]|uniref:uncharacterized protein isoform X2 n=1 Tax=Choristoneura fumiferana TaxID=7141 RepID=UPI003D159271
MALVLRKAVMPRNVSLLKCIKGRTLATTANKNTPVPLAAGVFRRSLKDAAVLKPLGHAKCKTKQVQLARGRGTGRPHALRRCVSCPELTATPRARLVARHSSLPRTRRICLDSNPLSKYPLTSPLAALSAFSFLNSRAGFAIAKRGFMSNSSCCGPCGPCRPCSPCCAPCCTFRTPPCGSPCNPCGTCLPPPGGNHAPQCLQYMTGYYYYPYGTWFCGPFHVAGKCVPVSSTCVPPQCCPAACCSCCITPAAAAAFMQGGLPMQGTQDMPFAPPSQVEVPLESSTNASSTPPPAEDASKKPRPGFSKFFPFNSSVAMGAKAAAFPKQDDSISSFEKKFSPKVAEAARSSSSHEPAKFHYHPRLNTPPSRKYSRCATDFVAPKTSSPIRHKHTSKQHYVWKIFDKPNTKNQSKPCPAKFYRATPLAQFKPYDS